MSGFTPILNFGHFWALPSPSTFHNVNNDGQSIFLGRGGRTTEKKDKREQNNSSSGVQVFRCLRRPCEGVHKKYGLCPFREFRVFRVDDRVFRKVKRVTREGPKNGQHSIWKVKTVTSVRGRPKNGQNFRWSEISTHWASSSAKKVLLTAGKVGSAQN